MSPSISADSTPDAAKAAARLAPESGASRSRREKSSSGEESKRQDLVDLAPWCRAAPPWLISAIFHMSLLIVFALWMTASGIRERLILEATVAEDLGEQLIAENLEMPLTTDTDFEEQILTPEDLPEVIDPLALPSFSEIAPRPTHSASIVPPTTIGQALQGREPGMKQALLRAYGGTEATQAAVMAGLEWLARQQLRVGDPRAGMWSLSGPYQNGASRTNDNYEAATAMALLAFQGAGYTPQDDPDAPFSLNVRRGWNALLKSMDEQGNFFRKGPRTHRLYTHALCTIAICELFGMTRDEQYRGPAQRAVDYCVKIQTPEGGWRYDPGDGSDLSVTGWFAMALQSARMAGLDVPSETFNQLSSYLDLVAKDDKGYYIGSRYSYRPPEGPKLSMTAEGLLCRQYLGWKHDDPRLRNGVEYLLEHPIEWNEGKGNVYYWYYATQVCHHMEGEWWDKWNARMRTVLPAHQEKRGRERGSWYYGSDFHSAAGGRLYVTCLSLYMLEVYYRHLPIYHRGLLDGNL